MNRFLKGYKHDAGIDIVLDKDVTLKAKACTIIDLNLIITPKRKQMVMIVPRTSAAIKGLNTALCPVDPDYIGHVHAVVFNFSDNDIEYKAGESFCQAVFIKLGKTTIKYGIKKKGSRDYGKFGSTK